MIDNRYWDNSKGPSADTAIEQARGEWERMYRDNQAAGRETPVVEIPREMGDVARASVEATQELTRRGNRRSFLVNIDIRALEAAARAEEARRQAEAEAETARLAQEAIERVIANHSKPARRPNGRPAGGKQRAKRTTR